MARANSLLIAFLLAFACENVVSQNPTTHSLWWDRFWLDENLENNMLEVRLGDTITFNCQVNDSAEAEADLIENIVLLEEEEHLNNCDTGSKGVGEKLSVCSRQGFDYTLPITNSPELENRLSFEAGGTYYFTSFSDGTLSGAEQNSDKGGACAANPPLRLTIIITAASSTVSSSTTEQPTSSSSSTNIKVMPTSTKEISTVKVVTPSKDIIPLPTAPLPPQITAGALSGAGLLSPMQSVLLLLLFITCILIL